MQGPVISFGDENSNISLEVCLFLEGDISGVYYDERRKFGGAFIMGNFNTQLLFNECIFKKHIAMVNLKIKIKEYYINH